MDIKKVNEQLVFTHTNGTTLIVGCQGLESPETHATVRDFIKSDEKIWDSDTNPSKESRLFIPLFYRIIYGHENKVLPAIDKFFPFADMFDCSTDVSSLITCGFPFEEIPKDFIEFCNREVLGFNRQSYVNFLFYKLTQNLPYKYYSILREIHDNKLCNNWVNHYKKVLELVIFAKVFINSTKRANEVVRIQDIMAEINHLSGSLDETKTLKENIDILKAEERERKSSEIREVQEQFQFLEEFCSEGLKVVVPLSLEELEDENRQQCSDVGTCYIEDIIEKDCFIYFIRAEDELERSYITCRYDLNEQVTLEGVAKFNAECIDEVANILMEKVDKAMSRLFVLNWE